MKPGGSNIALSYLLRLALTVVRNKPVRMRMEPKTEIQVTGSCKKMADAIMVETGDK